MFSFIIAPKWSSDFSAVSLEIPEFMHSFYIDEKYHFRKLNPKIPDNPMYHTFLINNKGIILVGNPLHNDKIKNIFYKTIESEIGMKINL